MLIWLYLVFGCFSVTMAEQLWWRLYGLQSLKYLLCGLLQEKFADPWIKVIPIMNWMFVSLQNSCLSPNPNVIVFGGRNFGRQLGLDEVIRVTPHNETNILIRRRREIRAPSLSAMWKHSEKVASARWEKGLWSWKTITILNLLQKSPISPF